MQDYIVSLQRAASTLEKSMPLPPLGEHVTYLQNALVSRVRPLALTHSRIFVFMACRGFRREIGQVGSESKVYFSVLHKWVMTVSCSDPLRMFVCHHPLPPFFMLFYFSAVSFYFGGAGRGGCGGAR